MIVNMNIEHIKICINGLIYNFNKKKKTFNLQKFVNLQWVILTYTIPTVSTKLTQLLNLIKCILMYCLGIK